MYTQTCVHAWKRGCIHDQKGAEGSQLSQLPPGSCPSTVSPHCREGGGHPLHPPQGPFTFTSDEVISLHVYCGGFGPGFNFLPGLSAFGSLSLHPASRVIYLKHKPDYASTSFLKTFHGSLLSSGCSPSSGS